MSVVADLDTLKRAIGSTTTRDDDLLGWALDSASTHIADRVYAADYLRDDVQQAVLLMAARLYKRRQSPEGVAGWDEQGVVRIIANDPDIAALLERREDYTRIGIA